jgi:hypothetical protein
MCGNTRPAVAPVAEGQAARTQFGTTLTLDGTGATAATSLLLRLRTLAHTSDGRVSYGEITFDDLGRPTCPVGFDCSAYDPPVDDQPNPDAVRDFQELIEGVNADSCLFTGTLIPR